MTRFTEEKSHGCAAGAPDLRTGRVRPLFRRIVRERGAPPPWWLSARREERSFIDDEAPE
ncbi:MAG: hypothetical protein EON96_16710 [Caulobacteraceae bacterium]|nr:MAG: hypothetical protein EON96_16710 [Caulobacteraceae bacterium]